MRLAVLSFLSLLSLVVTGCDVEIGDCGDAGCANFGDGDGDGGGDGDGDGDDSDGGAGDGDGDSGDGDSGDGDGDGDDVAVGDFAAGLAAALCAAEEACIGSAQQAEIYSYSECAVFLGRLLAAGELGQVPASVEAGRIVYDAAGVQACFDEVAAAGCASASTRPPAGCKAAIAGQAALDADCNIDFDCEGDAFCAGDSCPGTCTARVADGESCSARSQCQTGMKCIAGECSAGLAAGEGCDLGQCESGLECRDIGAGMTCLTPSEVYSESEVGVCDAFGGAPLCDNTTGSALTCQFDSAGGSTGSCRPAVAAGEPCVDAVPDQCPLEQYCVLSDDDLSGKCALREQSGGACSLDTPKACGEDLVCVIDTCRPRSAVGESCDEHSRCDSGICGGDGSCVARVDCE